MQSQSLTFLAATIIASLFSIDAYASTVVYEQAPNTNYFSQSAVFNDPTDTGFNWTIGTDSQSFEYFGVASNISFNRIGWYGNNADGDFAVDLFSETCYSCGATPVNGSGTFTHASSVYESATLLPNPGPFSQAQVHKALVSGSLFSYYIDLTSTLTLDHTQGYALSVVNNYSSLPFGWALSNTTGNHVQYAQAYAGYKFLPSYGDLAFTLTNTLVSAVPLPAAVWLMLTGLMTMLGVNSRRSRCKNALLNPKN